MFYGLAVTTETGRAAIEDWRVLGSRCIFWPVPVLVPKSAVRKDIAMNLGTYWLIALVSALIT